MVLGTFKAPLVLACLSSVLVLHACAAKALYGLMLEQHAEIAWEQQLNMRVDVIARMASSFAASGRTPVEPVMRFAIQNSSWWEQEHNMLEIKEFKDSSVTDNFHESFLGVVQHSLGEFFDIPYLDSVLPTGFISHESWMELCERQMHLDQTQFSQQPISYCVIDKVIWATRDEDKDHDRCHPGAHVLVTSVLDLKFLARKVICVDYQRATQQQLQSLLSDPSEGTVAFYRWDHLSGSYGEPNHTAFRFNNAVLSSPLEVLESISTCTELDVSGCESCSVSRGRHFCDVAVFHWRRGDRATNPNFLSAFSEYVLTMPRQASTFVKAELMKRNISVLYLATNSGRMDEVLLMERLLHPIRIHSSIRQSADWTTAIIRAVSDMAVASLAGFFIMSPSLRGSHVEGVSTFSRRIMLQRIHHHGLTGGSHFAVCCGDLTSIKILTPKIGTVLRLSESSSVLIEVTAVVLNPLKNSEVYAQLQDSSGFLSPRIQLFALGSGVIIQSGRVMGVDEPDNIAYLWAATLALEFPGKYVIEASAGIFVFTIIFACSVQVRWSNVSPFWRRSSTLKATRWKRYRLLARKSLSTGAPPSKVSCEHEIKSFFTRVVFLIVGLRKNTEDIIAKIN